MTSATNLTDAFVAAAKPMAGRQVEFPDAKVRGLALRVSAKGKKSWTFRFRNMDGRQRRLTLGSYPATPLVKARAMALDAMRDTHNGKDPASERRAEKARAGLKTIRTVSDLADDYFAAARLGRHRNEARPKRESTLKLEQDYFDRLLRPKFGSLEVNELLRPDLQRFLDTTGRDAPSAARQCRNIIRQIYNFGIRREVTDKNPAQFADVPKSKSRERVLTDAEVKAIWAVCDDPDAVKEIDLSKTMALAIQFALATLQRGNEVCGATIDEFDLEARTWTISGARTKNHRAHVVPLSDLALRIVSEALSLPAHQRDEKQANDRPLFFVLRSSQPLTRRALTRAMKRITNHQKIKDATPHDFRRTGSTAMTSERLGIPRFHVSAVLNHISDTGGAAAVTAVYDRNQYLPQKRVALEKWAQRLREIVGEIEPASNVIGMWAQQ